jgi:hypothetical protein
MDQDPQRFVQLNALQSKEGVWQELCEKLSARMNEIEPLLSKKNARRAGP